MLHLTELLRMAKLIYHCEQHAAAGQASLQRELPGVNIVTRAGI
jgi:hypothetical protein